MELSLRKQLQQIWLRVYLPYSDIAFKIIIKSLRTHQCALAAKKHPFNGIPEERRS